MDLHHRLVERANRQITVASLVALLLGAVSLFLAIRTWTDRVFLDDRILFGIADAIVVMVLGFWLQKRSSIAVLLLMILGVAGLIYSFREGMPWIAAIPNLIALVFYAKAWSALRYLRASAVQT